MRLINHILAMVRAYGVTLRFCSHYNAHTKHEQTWLFLEESEAEHMVNLFEKFSPDIDCSLCLDHGLMLKYKQIEAETTDCVLVGGYQCFTKFCEDQCISIGQDTLQVA